MARSQPDALWRQQIDEPCVRRRQMLIHGGDHTLIGMRPGHAQHLGVPLENSLRIGAQTAGHEYAAVLLEGLADGL